MLTHGTPTRIVLADAAVDQLDTGAGTASAHFLIYAADDTLLCDITLANPAFGSANGSAVASAAGLPLIGTAPTITGGPKNATKFTAVNRSGAIVFQGTVTATGGGGDATIDNVSIATGQQVNLTSCTYTAPV